MTIPTTRLGASLAIELDPVEAGCTTGRWTAKAPWLDEPIEAETATDAYWAAMQAWSER